MVIDLNGDGFSTKCVTNGTYFDLDSNGSSEKTGWITGDDAFLALDLNGDGKITHGGELFGDYTLLQDGTRAKDGFHALAQYDENGDGLIDEKDSIFSSLVVWHDKNNDGQSSADELHTLDEVNISAIRLNASVVNTTDPDTKAFLSDLPPVGRMDGHNFSRVLPLPPPLGY